MTVPRSKGRCGRPWRRLRADIAAQRRPCWICGQRINYQLPYRDPWTGAVNVWSYTVHHIVPIVADGAPLDPKNCVPSHLNCNQRVGVGVVAALVGAELTTSRAW
ncbi:MAG: HNH endonuclease [Actinobacteria bacterium]|nr:HNH endonuclease [Actinomycetota bacterium]